jgi:hypothetical protein
MGSGSATLDQPRGLLSHSLAKMGVADHPHGGQATPLLFLFFFFQLFFSFLFFKKIRKY